MGRRGPHLGAPPKSGGKPQHLPGMAGKCHYGNKGSFPARFGADPEIRIHPHLFSFGVFLPLSTVVPPSSLLQEAPKKAGYFRDSAPRCRSQAPQQHSGTSPCSTQPLASQTFPKIPISALGTRWAQASTPSALLSFTSLHPLCRIPHFPPLSRASLGGQSPNRPPRAELVEHRGQFLPRDARENHCRERFLLGQVNANDQGRHFTQEFAKNIMMDLKKKK